MPAAFFRPHPFRLEFRLRFKPVLLIVAAFLCAACGASDEAPPPLASLGGAASSPTMKVEHCDNGDYRECTVVHELANGNTSCATGVQFCEETRWQPCEEDTEGLLAP